ncbi:MAG: hypothetical protein RIQ89_50 [Bacteroidota bacterium]|jgi:outer membrane protein OmpA-like peptidoglycan-associated protein/tetratricopeptide (TPR) repeat protein
MYKIFLLVLIIFQGWSAQSQIAKTCPPTASKKATQYYEDARKQMNNGDLKAAFDYIEKSIEADAEYAAAYHLQGLIAARSKDFEGMIASYKKAMELCPEVNAEMYFNLANHYFNSKNYKEAAKMYASYLEFDNLPEKNLEKATSNRIKAQLMGAPVPFNPVSVKGLSTTDPEYLPYISPDHELAFFTRRFRMEKKGMLTPADVEKFMFSQRGADGFQKGSIMPEPFNSRNEGNEGAASISIDNKVLYFTINDGGNFDICTSVLENNYWQPIQNLGSNINHPKQWDAQPSIASDGRTLYFASARDSSSGMDIYQSVKDEKGMWSKATKLPVGLINTDGQEKSPFMHSDSRTLYFCSNALPGMGGFDIFKTSLDTSGKWSTPVNIGYPINTEADEVGFIVSTDGKTAYFASNSLKGMGGYDIYSFELHEAARPQKVLLQKGKLAIKDEESKSATIEVRDAVTNKMQSIEVDSVTGNYAFVANLDHDLVVSFKKNDYAFQSQYVSAADTFANGSIIKDVELNKISVGQAYKINDILFATNSFTINDTIRAVLESFAIYLKENPKLKVAINGHTDNVGDAQSNLILSQNRAKTVYDFLLSKAIASSRLSYKGYGATAPVASNDSEEGRARNRRTVFTVIAK